jgi:2-oxoglutarate/2-oxoacid ferredoxin oxidoreductase subunit beta
VASLLNSGRPPVFCPGCSHERMVRALDEALIGLGLRREEIAIVSDIGCSGLFDTFFDTHAFHGLHGRALTYATGLKMARPDLTVIVTMGDGGLGIGGAHVQSACRRNIGLTLLVMNNFNYGMTGGQCSSTTPVDAQVGSGFLNRLEKPMDIGYVAGAAGAGYVARTSVYRKDLVEQLQDAIRFDGFSVVDVHGICPGRYARKNKLTPASIEEGINRGPALDHFKDWNRREEYSLRYRREAAGQKRIESPLKIEAQGTLPATGRHEVIILGSAGQRIVTAGEILCLACVSAGLNASQKNDYPITVLRGHSISELILSDQPIGYTGITRPSVVVALADEGVAKRKRLPAGLSSDTLVIAAHGVELPVSGARVVVVDFKSRKIKPADWALAALAVLAGQHGVLNESMLEAGLKNRFNGPVLETALSLVGSL